MIAKLLPLVLVLAGAGAGVGAGIALRPDAAAEEDHAEAAEGGDHAAETETAGMPDAPHADTPCGDVAGGKDAHAAKDDGHGGAHGDEGGAEFVKIPEQFVIPVVAGERVKSLVVMSLTLEVDPAAEENVFVRLPKLRDGFLRVMLDHANIGGFDGAFTSNGSMDTLRRGLNQVATKQFPHGIHDVLVLDINRQDLL